MNSTNVPPSPSRVRVSIIARYGGTIEKFIGDAVMAVWGVPTAGVDLVAAVAAFGESVGAPGLAMRVGIVTGESR